MKRRSGSLPALSEIRELLSYDSETGLLMWLTGQRKGRVAGTRHAKGHLQVSVKRKMLKAHRVAWLLARGEWPQVDIDHLNGDPADNRISNLREVTNAQNQQNRRRANRNSKSKLLGASWDEARGVWQSRIKLRGKQWYLGRFTTAEAAHAAYVSAKRSVHPYGTL